MIGELLKKFMALTCAAFLAVPALASEPIQRTNTNTLWFESWGALTNATLSVVTPEGDQKQVFADRGTPVFNLRDVAPAPDGIYRYELTAATEEKVKIKNPINNGRGDNARSETNKPMQMTGFFIVKGGAITVEKEVTEASDSE